MTWRTVVCAGSRSAATTCSAISHPVIVPTRRLFSPTGSVSQPRSAINCAAALSVSPGVTTSTSGVIRSPTFIARLRCMCGRMTMNAKQNVKTRSSAPVASKARVGQPGRGALADGRELPQCQLPIEILDRLALLARM